MSQKLQRIFMDHAIVITAAEADIRQCQIRAAKDNRGYWLGQAGRIRGSLARWKKQYTTTRIAA
jgi:hypothetical protein